MDGWDQGQKDESAGEAAAASDTRSQTSQETGHRGKYSAIKKGQMAANGVRLRAAAERWLRPRHRSDAFVRLTAPF